jgi:hypothetical protein
LLGSQPTLAQVRALRQLEAACCPALRFDIRERKDEILWEISGNAQAQQLLAR